MDIGRARQYWEFSYDDEEIKRLWRKWEEISDELYQPENMTLNLERRKVVALEKIAEVLAQSCDCHR